MSPDHECPDCGNVHRLNRDERIRRLEAEVERLKNAEHHCDNHACPHRPYWWWTPRYYPTVTTSPWDNGTSVTYTDSGTAPSTVE